MIVTEHVTPLSTWLASKPDQQVGLGFRVSGLGFRDESLVDSAVACELAQFRRL